MNDARRWAAGTSFRTEHDAAARRGICQSGQTRASGVSLKRATKDEEFAVMIEEMSRAAAKWQGHGYRVEFLIAAPPSAKERDQLI